MPAPVLLEDVGLITLCSVMLPSVTLESQECCAARMFFRWRRTMKSMRANHFVNKDGPTIQSDPHAVYLTGSNALATVPSSCSDTITPSCLRALYKTSDYVPRATKKNKLGVAGYLNEFATK